MDKALDMSLDDIIKSNKTSRRGRGRGRGSERGGASRGRGGRGSFSGGRLRGTGRGAGWHGPLGVNARPSAFTIAKSFRRAKNFPWKHDLFEDSLAAAGLPSMENGTKLCISNLERGVSSDDIWELFSEIGELKRYAIYFDRNGQPSGFAEVVYVKRSDAFAAQKRYNNVQLDGRPMKIEIVSPNSRVPVATHVSIVGDTNGKTTRRVVMTQTGARPISSASTNRGIGQRTRGRSRNGPGRGQPPQGRGVHSVQGRGSGSGSGWGRGRGRGWRRGRGRGRKQAVEKSAEELDKELDTYHADGMQIS